MFTKLLKLTTALTLLLSMALSATPVLAAGASIYLTASKSTVASGSSVIIGMYVNGGGTPLNAVQVDLNFPSSKLQYVGFSSTGSAFEIGASNSGGDGYASVARGTTSPVSGSALVGTVTLRALSTSGSGAVTVASSSNLVNANDSSAVAYSSSGATIKFGAETTATHGASTTPTVSAPKDTTPPKISDVKATNVTPFGATITWTTEEAADSVVQYGLDTNYGLSASATGATTTHSVALNSTFLTPQTLIHYQVKSADAAGNVVTGTDQTLLLPGVSVTVIVRGPDGAPQSGVSVTLDGSTGTTNSQGTVTLTSSLGDKKVTTVYQGVIVQKSINVGRTTKPLPPVELDLSRQPLNGWMLTSLGLVVVVVTLLGLDAMLFGSRFFGRIHKLQFAVAKPAPRAFHLPQLNHRLVQEKPLMRREATVAEVASPAPNIEPKPEPVAAPAPKPDVSPAPVVDPMEKVTKLMGGPPPDLSQPTKFAESATKTEAPPIGHFAKSEVAEKTLVIDVKPPSELPTKPATTEPTSITVQSAPPLSAPAEAAATPAADVAERLKKKPTTKKRTTKSRRSKPKTN